MLPAALLPPSPLLADAHCWCSSLVLDADYGEARGFPQNTKCRGTVSDLAGFQKETAYWYQPGYLL